MQDKILYILIGYSICSTLVLLFCIYLLYKKPTVKNEIKSLKQKNKHNKNTNNDNDINTSITPEKPRKRIKRGNKGKLKRIFTKKKNK